MKRLLILLPVLALSGAPSFAEVDFSRDIRPILNAHCVACHGGVKEAGEVSFIYRDKALGKGESGKPVIVPGKPDESEMLVRILSEDASEVMPKPAHGPPLSKNEAALIRQWISEGAPWKEHWSFVPPVRHPAPAVQRKDWPKQDLDRFILARLEKEGLAPTREAAPADLLRRVSLDLTGLPPTLAELDAFLVDQDPKAYEKQVDRLLDSPHFGERWASVWMDLARYADSEGLGQDHRRDVWKYRDWLIQAFNRDMPFDQFTIEQLAGDLLPGATLDQRIATAFHRLTQANNEGGTDDEEFRVAAVMDRVATTWEVWQGLTMGCVQCHSHPYDPIQHQEYYASMAFFNSTEDADIPEGFPILSVPMDNRRHAESGHLQDSIRKLEMQFFHLHQGVSESSSWQPTTGMTGEAKKARLEIRREKSNEEFRTAGNLTAGAVFTLNIPLPAQQAPVTAIRLEILPVDEATALHTPEWGSLIQKIKLDVVGPEGDLRSEALAEILPDEAHPPFDPNGSLQGAKRGWGAYTKLDRPRSAVLLPARPVRLGKGESLRLTLEHSSFSAGGSFPLVTKRGRLFLSTDARWSGFLADSQVSNIRKDLTLARKKLKAIPSTTLPDMREQPASLRRPTHVFVRGNWLSKGEAVARPNTPRVFAPMTGNPDRLALARWIASPANPLTARVAVNRVWLELFGTGIVPTPEDFGSAGEKPTHPELLNTLSVRLQTDMKWSLKTLLKELVTSATYRQDATIPADLQERDADNRLLARGPRQRLTGEMVRDQGLLVSGLLVDKQGGPPAFPPLPAGVWTPFDNDKWTTPAAGAPERYRRSVYTYWKRSIPYPVFNTFDAPARELCSKRRIVSNTPLQALTILNDPAFQEFSAGLAHRMTDEFSGSLEQRLSTAYRTATSRTITPARLNELKSLFLELKQEYLTQEKPQKNASPTAEEAASTVVASVLLNLDEALTR